MAFKTGKKQEPKWFFLYHKIEKKRLVAPVFPPFLITDC